MTEIKKMDLKSMDVRNEKLRELREVFPEVFTDDNKIDFEKLRLTLGENVEVGKERYSMTWPGKADCFKIIQQPSVGSLKPCREESVNFDETENLFIEGDNLEVLKLLQKSYYGKIKMIYSPCRGMRGIFLIRCRWEFSASAGVVLAVRWR